MNHLRLALIAAAVLLVSPRPMRADPKSAHVPQIQVLGTPLEAPERITKALHLRLTDVTLPDPRSERTVLFERFERVCGDPSDDLACLVLGVFLSGTGENDALILPQLRWQCQHGVAVACAELALRLERYCGGQEESSTPVPSANNEAATSPEPDGQGPHAAPPPDADDQPEETHTEPSEGISLRQALFRGRRQAACATLAPFHRCAGDCRRFLALAKRTLETLDTLGYRSRLTADGTVLSIHLWPHPVVRKVYISGNWPLAEDLVRRHIHLRPGQRVPLGAERTRFFERQGERLQRFLRQEGYFENRVEIRASSPNRRGEVNIHVRLHRGRSYKVGQVRVEPMAPPTRPSVEPPTSSPIAEDTAPPEAPSQPDERPDFEPAIPREEIEDVFIHHLIPHVRIYQRRFNTRQLQDDVEALRRLYHAYGYPGIRIKESYRVDPQRPPDRAVEIQLQVRERKQILVRYQGRRRVSESELDSTLTFAKSGAYDDYEAAESCRQLERLYQSKGYLQARVRFSRIVDRERDIVIFHIDEGPQWRVASVSVRGNERVATSRLRDVIYTETYPWLGWGEGGYVTPVQLRQDVERLAARYRELGFLSADVRAEIVPDPVLFGHPAALAAATLREPVPRRGNVDVRFFVDEGPRYRVGDVHIEGAQALTPPQLTKPLALQRDRPFSPRALEEDRERILAAYAQSGYPYARVRSTADLAAPDRRPPIVHDIEHEGPQVRFGPIFLRGNFHTRDFVLRSALGFLPGDIYSPRQIEQAESNLRQLNIFNGVQIQTLPPTTGDETELAAMVNVEERYDDWGAVELGVGGSTDNPFFGTAGYDNGNIFGLGIGFNLRGEVGPEIQSGNLGIRDSRFFGLPFSAEIQGFFLNQVTVRLGDITTYGGTVTLRKLLVPNLFGSFSYVLSRTIRRESLYRAAGPVDESSQESVPTRTAGIGPTLIYDTRDNLLLPTRGVRLSAALLWAAPFFGGTDHFLRLSAHGQAFIPLPFGAVIAMGVRHDHGIPLGGAVMLPKAERFFAGGDTTIRGFLEDRAFAQRVLSPASPLTSVAQQELVPLGGNIRFLTNLELQIPIWPESILFGLPLLAAAFTDHGVVLNSFDTFTWEQFRHSVGAALRVVTPVGFVSFEYAWPLDPLPGDPVNGRFHFNFGFVF